MKKYQNIDNKKLLIKLEKPRLLHILSNNKFHYKVNTANTLNKNNNHKTSLSPLVLVRNNKISNITNNYNNIYNNYANKKNNNFNSPNKTYNNMKDKTNNTMKTTPLKYQYKKIPFEKVKGLKIKLPNSILNDKKRNNNNNNININNINNRKNTQQKNYYPIIAENNLSTIQSNANTNTKKEKNNKKNYYNINYKESYKKNTINTNIDGNMNNIRNNILYARNDIINNNTINNNTIQEEEMNKSNIKKKIIIFNDNKKSLYQQLKETKSSSIGSKLETREESGHFLKSRSKSSINSPQLFNNINVINNRNNLKPKNFSFLKFNGLNHQVKLSSKKKILKYLDKTIKQLTKIKTIILDEKDCEEYKYDDKEDKEEKEDKEDDINEDDTEEEKIKEENKNKYIKIDLDKIGKNLERYKNKIDIDKRTINISYEANNNEIYPYHRIGNNKKGNNNPIKKLNKTITYDDLKCNIREKQKLLNINHKNFKNFRKTNIIKRNKSEKNYKYNTLNAYTGDYFNYKRTNKKDDNNYKIKNYDTEIKIPQLKIFHNKNNVNNNNTLNKINEEEYFGYNNLNEKYNNEYNQERNNISDIANFEFSD